MIQSIERAMMIIHVLAKNPKRFFSVQDIYNETDLPSSTIYRLLYTLENFDLVERNEEKRNFV